MSETKERDGANKDSATRKAGSGPAPQHPETASPHPLAAEALSPGGVASRRVEILIAHREGALHPQSTDQIAQALAALPDFKVRKALRPSGLAVLAADAAGASDVLVAETSLSQELELRLNAGPALIVERNLDLEHFGGITLPGPQPVAGPVVATATSAITVPVKVQDTQGRPVGKALVTVVGHGLTQAVTNAQGLATLSIFGTAVTGITGLHVKPSAEYWDIWIPNPELRQAGPNTVTLEPLKAFQPAGFNEQHFIGWGQRLIGLGEGATELTGQGARVAIIDSGADNTHPSLTHLRIGRDFTNPDADPQGWTQDTLGLGTHLAGIVAGNGHGIRGFAPQAELHVLKLFPGGRLDGLISALAYAVDNRIDVVLLSLGTSQVSEAVARRLDQARKAGVAVVVGAGNTAGPSLFPANLPGVFAVSAIGQRNIAPDHTTHARAQAGPGGINGIFAAGFTSGGPLIRVAAPGVAIISSVPGGGYGAWDGTGPAAAHVAGLLALIAAHHPALGERGLPRNAARVERLFQILTQATVPLGLDPIYGGAGLPLLARLLQPSALPPGPWAEPVAPAGQDVDAIIRQQVYTAVQQQGLAPGGFHGPGPAGLPWVVRP
ncbi:S8 family serine peptidase [Rhodovastum atsumiense]|nr:S8 family serine peptidase [Rhodovastum atsumiense]CAH2599273.1 S8 family serine peptidase [Rhodovastum atsumiense]